MDLLSDARWRNGIGAERAVILSGVQALSFMQMSGVNDRLATHAAGRNSRRNVQDSSKPTGYRSASST